MITSSKSVEDIGPLDHDEAMDRAEAEVGRLLHLVDLLTEDEWLQPTDCAGWSVKDILAHLLGMWQLQADPEDRARQLSIATERAARNGTLRLDELTALQVAEHAQLPVGELREALRDAAPRALASRRALPPEVRATPYDPFAGSGTTLVEANALGIHAIGADVSAFNCLLMRVKVAPHDLAALRRDLDRALAAPPADPPPSEWLARWYAPAALRDLAGFCSAIPGSAEAETLAVVASRAARSARLAAHHDLDMPRAPVRGPYACHKHRRECRPGRAGRSLPAQVRDRHRAAAGGVRRCRGRPRTSRSLHADARTVDLPERIDGIVTSPPYPGLIDYHEQHRYAYELLGLDDRRELELGAAAAGTARRAIDAYCDGIAETLARARPSRSARRRPPRSSSTTAATSTTRSPAGPATRSPAATCGT